MIEIDPKIEEKVILVGICPQGQSIEKIEEYLDELAFLAETAGGITVKSFIQKMERPDHSFFVGSGKVKEIKEAADFYDASTIIFDEELSPVQQRNLEEELKLKIIDRTSLILDIFAARAKTAQAKTQVELAQMQYLLPRLKGLWTHLERQRGGIGMRGPGEKEIETDRRVIKDKIALLKDQLKKLDSQNQTMRKTRGQMVRTALVGYTNVGKSTIMNLIAKSDILAENKLFATLDTTVRKVVIENVPFLLSDTVGFIRKLPHNLIESFKTTLDEACESDIILHVIDASHESFHEQIEVVNTTLAELGAQHITTLMIFNKMDTYRDKYLDKFLPDETKNELMEEFKKSLSAQFNHKTVFISATNKENIDEFRQTLVMMVQDMYHKRYPYMVNFYS